MKLRAASACFQWSQTNRRAADPKSRSFSSQSKALLNRTDSPVSERWPSDWLSGDGHTAIPRIFRQRPDLFIGQQRASPGQPSAPRIPLRMIRLLARASSDLGDARASAHGSFSRTRYYLSTCPGPSVQQSHEIIQVHVTIILRRAVSSLGN